MKTQAWTTIDKATWGAGPWQQEPDKRQWPDAATGLPCLMVRHTTSGHWCGYVGVAEGHPAYQKDYNDVDVEVHGGLTFADKCQPTTNEAEHVCHVPDPGEPDHVWWLGFDCAHSGDTSPAYDRRYRGYDDHASYKDQSYVEAQCRRLAQQLHALSFSERSEAHA